MMHATIKEDFLYYVWKTKNFDVLQLKTTDGKSVSIKKWGIQNRDAGPDFDGCLVDIDGIEWAGSVEMHVFSSEWDRHGHDLDDAYNTVILHVVYEHDREVCDAKGRQLITLELKDYIREDLVKHYLSLVKNTSSISCASYVPSLPSERVSLWVDQLAVRRLERKYMVINDLLQKYQNDWLQVLIIQLSRYMGGKVNQLAFQMLFEATPLKSLLKIQDNPIGVDALLFGQAGMLEGFTSDDAYEECLRKEYQHYKTKYSLTPLNPVVWKFAKMRPANFPSIRLAQLSALIQSHGSFLFDRMIIDYEEDVWDVALNPYWDYHYRLGKKSIQKEKHIGKSLIDLIKINVIAPMRFAYGTYNGDDSMRASAIDYLSEVKAESNTYTRKYKALGITASSALQSQGLIELYTEYCSPKRCMSCALGHHIIHTM